MKEAILTGIFALLGVVLGGISSWIVAAYTSKTSHAEKVIEKQQELCLNMLICLNEMIQKLPKSNEELFEFKEYLLSEFYPKRDAMVLAEEMLYLTDDIRATYMAICIFAENDYELDCEYDVIGQKIIVYRNIFVKMLREDLKIQYEKEDSKKKDKRFDRLMNKQLEIGE